MADTKSPIPFDQLIAELAGLVATGSTGTLYITSTENRAIRIQLQDGEIVTCFFGPKQGMEALERIRNIAGGSFRFDPKAPPITADRSLPATDLILAQLGHTPSQAALKAQGVPVPANPPPAAAVPPAVDDHLEEPDFDLDYEPSPAEPAEKTLEEMFLETTAFHDQPPGVADPAIEEMFQETTGFYDVAAAAEQMAVPKSEFALATELVNLEFACFVGPVASVWTMNYVMQFGQPHSGPELRRLIESMAAEIQVHDRRRVRDFIGRVKQRLEPIL